MVVVVGGVAVAVYVMAHWNVAAIKMYKGYRVYSIYPH